MSVQGIIGGLGKLGILGGARIDFPYPTFQKTTLVRFRQASDFTTDASYSVTDIADPDNIYGNPTSPMVTGASGQNYLIRPPALTTTSGVDVRGGQIRINYKPIANVTTNLSTFTIRLFSTTNPASPGSNYHQLAISGTFKAQATSATGVGRPQSIAGPVAAFTANGTGADLSSIRLVQILGFGTAQYVITDIDFYQNPRSKGAVIWRYDDGDAKQYTDAFPILSALNIPAMLMPGAIGSATGIGQGSGALSIAQYQALLAAGWQSASQCYSTENSVIVDGWTRDQRMAEYAAARNFVKPYGRYRDTYDGSYYSNVGFRDLTAWPELRDSFRTLTNFVNGSATGNPLAVSEVFPFADPKNIVCLNFNSWGDVSDIYSSHLFLALEQTRACKGVLIIGSHAEIAGANFKAATNSVNDYVLNQFPNEMEFTTIRRLLAPYNGDTLMG